MRKFVKLLWLISIVVFLALLLYVYAYTIDKQKFELLLASGQVTMVSRQNFFYIILGLFIMSNILLNWFGVILYVRNHKSWHQSYSDKMGAVVYGLIFVLNLFFAVSVILIGVLNGPNLYDVSNYFSLLLVPCVLFLVWLIFSGIVMIQKNK